MSDYRPWAPQVDEAQEGPDVGDEAGPGYTPWAPGQAPPPVDPPKEKRFETPPGLGEAPPRRKGDTAHETAAAMLLWTGGFLLVASIVFMAIMTLAIDFEAIDMRYGSHGDYDDIVVMQDIRAAGGWGIFASLLFLAPGVGLLYRQPWARPVGFIAASVALLLVPIGTALGIIGLVNLSRMEGP